MLLRGRKAIREPGERARGSGILDNPVLKEWEIGTEGLSISTGQLTVAQLTERRYKRRISSLCI